MTSRVLSSCAVAAMLIVTGTTTLRAQAPPPLPGQRNQAPAAATDPARAGEAAEESNLPTAPVVSPLATASGEVTGPGTMFPALFSLPPDDDFAHFGYEAREYFVSGTANAKPYKTRIVVRKPIDDSRFSGLVLAESMHPSGNAWMFHFTHRYLMDAGHVSVEIVTSSLPLLLNHNEARYRDLKIEDGAGERDHCPGRRAAEIQQAWQPVGWFTGTQADSRWHVGVRACADQFPARACGIPSRGHEPHLRWLSSNQQRLRDSAYRCTADSSPDHDRGQRRDVRIAAGWRRARR